MKKILPIIIGATLMFLSACSQGTTDTATQSTKNNTTRDTRIPVAPVGNSGVAQKPLTATVSTTQANTTEISNDITQTLSATPKSAIQSESVEVHGSGGGFMR